MDYLRLVTHLVSTRLLPLFFASHLERVIPLLSISVSNVSMVLRAILIELPRKGALMLAHLLILCGGLVTYVSVEVLLP